MFFLFGFGTKRRNIGAGETRACPNCHNTTQWALVEQANQFTLFFIPVARWKRVRFEQCGICGATVQA